MIIAEKMQRAMNNEMGGVSIEGFSLFSRFAPDRTGSKNNVSERFRPPFRACGARRGRKR